MRDRHWKMLMQTTGKHFTMDEKFCLGDLLALELHNYVDACRCAAAYMHYCTSALSGSQHAHRISSQSILAVRCSASWYMMALLSRLAPLQLLHSPMSCAFWLLSELQRLLSWLLLLLQ
jgi:hypothetical protein